MRFKEVYAVLEGKNPVFIDDLNEWAEKYGAMTIKEKRVGYDEITGKTCVITTFMGVNMGVLEKRPLLFETKVFSGGKRDGEIWRYGTWEDAAEGHKEIVSILKKECGVE